MSWTQAQRDALAAAIARGTLRVVFQSGGHRREKEYHSLQEMRDLLAEMDRDLNPTANPPFRRVKFNKGFR